MKITGFTTWLLVEGLQLPKDDPVHRYAVHVNRDVEWPCQPGYQTLDEVLAHHKRHDGADVDHLASITYTAKLAWEDYQKWLSTTTK